MSILDVNALLQVNGHHGNGRPSVRDRELAAQVVQELRDENGVLNGQLDRLIQENAGLRSVDCTGCTWHGKYTTRCAYCRRKCGDKYRREPDAEEAPEAPDPDRQHNPCDTCARNPIKCGPDGCEKKRRFDAARNDVLK